LKRYLVEYLAIVLVLMGWDAMSSCGERVRYQFLVSLTISLLWPLSVPLAIIIAVRRTRHLPKGGTI
jgi:hypothetical protein